MPAVSSTTGESQTGRVEAFSDGVFAIAITLLVFQIRVPRVGRGESLPHAVFAAWPSLLAFVLSFVVIGLIWVSHHDVFRHVRRTNHPLQLFNLLTLLMVAFIPYPTAVLGAHLGGAHEREAVLLYSGWLLVTSVVLNLPWLYLVARRDYFGLPFDHATVKKSTAMFALAPALYLGSMLLAFVSTAAALALYALPVILFLLPSPISAWDERA